MDTSDSNNILSISQQLNEKQIETVVNNYAKIKHYNKVELLTDAKPKKKTMNYLIRLNTLALGYKVYLMTRDKETYDVEDFNYENITMFKHCHKDIDIVNLKPRTEIFIICYCDKFDVSYINSSVYFEDYFKEYNVQNITVVTTNRLLKKVDLAQILEQQYNVKASVFSLFDVYPLIGSPNSLYGLAYGYELIEHEQSYNNKQYKLISVNDPIVKLLCGKPNQLIIHCRTCYETSPYNEISIRQIIDD